MQRVPSLFSVVVGSRRDVRLFARPDRDGLRVLGLARGSVLHRNGVDDGSGQVSAAAPGRVAELCGDLPERLAGVGRREGQGR